MFYDLMSFMSFIPEAGLQGTSSMIIKNFIGPVFILLIAVFGLLSLKDRKWASAFSLFGLAAVLSLVVFNADKIFGSGGVANKTVNDVVQSVNMILPMLT